MAAERKKPKLNSNPKSTNLFPKTLDQLKLRILQGDTSHIKEIVSSPERLEELKLRILQGGISHGREILCFDGIDLSPIGYDADVHGDPEIYLQCVEMGYNSFSRECPRVFLKRHGAVPAGLESYDPDVHGDDPDVYMVANRAGYNHYSLHDPRKYLEALAVGYDPGLMENPEKYLKALQVHQCQDSCKKTIRQVNI